MNRYECCFRSGRQFIFAEKQSMAATGLPLRLPVVAVAGLLVGLFLAITISFGGMAFFELTLLSMALLTLYHGYLLTFQRISSSVDIAGYFMLLACTVCCGALLHFVGRFSLALEIGALDRCILFSVSGVVLGLLIYGYVCLVCQEDERKHHLGFCGADGDALEESLCPEGNQDSWVKMLRGLYWVASLQWWTDCFTSVGLAEDKESGEPGSNAAVTVHNRSLKLVKVCFYASDDLFCMVPFGGISGRFVGFIRAEESRSFVLPKSKQDDPNAMSAACFTLKVFQPSLMDKELARTQVRRGQTLAFSDVEGMVKRSRLLSCFRGLPLLQAVHPCCDSSEDEANTGRLQGLVPLRLDKGGQHQGHHPMSRTTSAVGFLRRNTSLGNFHGQGAESHNNGDSSSSDAPGSPSRQEIRVAKPEEVVVRNRSNQEVRALLFRSNDYTYMVPLLGSSIPPDSEERFVPQSQASDFTLKVYSVGHGARELTYVTVLRGHTYNFCDSLLS